GGGRGTSPDGGADFLRGLCRPTRSRSADPPAGAPGDRATLHGGETTGREDGRRGGLAAPRGENRIGIRPGAPRDRSERAARPPLGGKRRRGGRRRSADLLADRAGKR